MKRLLLCLSAIMLLSLACTSSKDRDSEIEAINKLRTSLQTTDIIGDNPNVDQLLNRYLDFASSFPDDSLAPVFLREAADLNIAVGTPDRSIPIIDTLIATYPGFEDIAYCYFLKGWAFENAEQYDSAIDSYSVFVNNYPDHFLAPGIRTMLEKNLIGASQEQLQDYLIAQANDSNLAKSSNPLTR